MATVTFLQNASSSTTATTYNFSGQSFGVASADRHIIVVLSARSANSANSVTSVSIGGVSATVVGQSINPTSNTASTSTIVIAAVPTGATGTITVVYSASTARCSVGVYRATGLSSISALDVKTDNAAIPTSTLTVQDQGIAIGTAMSNGDRTTVWTGLDENFDASYATGSATHTAASTVTTGTSITTTATFNVSQYASAVFASWSPGQQSGVLATGWTTKTAKVWNGTAWVAKPVKVWNGTSWVTKEFKAYT